MTSLESTSKAQEFADAALASMREFEIPATPENYVIWYYYHSGTNPELTRSIDILLSNNREFTSELSEDLHEKFFGVAEQAEMVRNTSAKVEASIEKLVGTMSSAGDGASQYDKALASFSGQVADANSDELRGLISGILDETHKVQEQNNALQGQLQQSSGEISELRGNLEEMRREAMTDGLTGIANRKYFDEAFRHAATAAMENGEDLSLLLLDIDLFKKFNDNFGHQLGDQVLRLVARALTDNVKGRDLAARYGGEEFAVILPTTALKHAVIVADQIRKAVASKKIIKKSSGEDLGKITVSVGVAQFVPGEPLEDLITRADVALYAAKDQGRNRVSASSAKPPKLAVVAGE